MKMYPYKFFENHPQAEFTKKFFERIFNKPVFKRDLNFYFNRDSVIKWGNVEGILKCRFETQALPLECGKLKVYFYIGRDCYLLVISKNENKFKIEEFWLTNPIISDDYREVKKVVLSALKSVGGSNTGNVAHRRKGCKRGDTVEKYKAMGWFEYNNKNDDMFTVSAEKVLNVLLTDPEYIYHAGPKLAFVRVMVGRIECIYFPKENKFFYSKCFIYNGEYLKTYFYFWY